MCECVVVCVCLASYTVVVLQCDSRGELLASLSYQPVSHRLSVVVLKARHLPKMDMTGLSASKDFPDRLVRSEITDGRVRSLITEHVVESFLKNSETKGL